MDTPRTWPTKAKDNKGAVNDDKPVWRLLAHYAAAFEGEAAGTDREALYYDTIAELSRAALDEPPADQTASWTATAALIIVIMSRSDTEEISQRAKHELRKIAEMADKTEEAREGEG
tara:strand:- start:1786 stop:2136 length:351 start_codon:yes stop_codon:yes gene_type:complete